MILLMVLLLYTGELGNNRFAVRERAMIVLRKMEITHFDFFKTNDHEIKKRTEMIGLAERARAGDGWKEYSYNNWMKGIYEVRWDNKYALWTVYDMLNFVPVYQCRKLDDAKKWVEERR